MGARKVKFMYYNIEEIQMQSGNLSMQLSLDNTHLEILYSDYIEKKEVMIILVNVLSLQKVSEFNFDRTDGSLTQ